MKIADMTVVALLFAGTAPAGAQVAPVIPRTAEGRPDFQGEWVTRFPPAVFQRIKGATGLVVGDEEAHALMLSMWKRDQEEKVADPGDELATVYLLPKVKGEWRTSMLTSPADGKAPLTAHAETLRKQADAMFDSPADGPELRDWSERCLSGTGTAPFGMFPTGNIRQIVQTRDHVMIYSDDSGDTRIVGVGAKHRPAAILTFTGDSVARWEGDVLLVETLGLRDEWPERTLLPGLVVGAKSQVIERFSLLGPDELFYQFTVEDPVLYTHPWSAEYIMVRVAARFFENACHEGNFSLGNILRIARAAERKLVKP